MRGSTFFEVGVTKSTTISASERLLESAAIKRPEAAASCCGFSRRNRIPEAAPDRGERWITSPAAASPFIVNVKPGPVTLLAPVSVSLKPSPETVHISSSFE